MHAFAAPTPTPRDLGSLSDDPLLSFSASESGTGSGLWLIDTGATVAVLSNQAWVGTGVIIAWVTSGVLIALALGRRGHETRTLGALGLLLGPLLLGLARSNFIPSEAETSSIEVSPGAPLSGDRRALVAVLGAAGTMTDAVGYLQSIGSELGELTMIRPIPYESAGDRAWDETKQAAAAVLSEAALFVPDLHPRLLLVPGRGERAIRQFLEDDAFDVALAVGSPHDLVAVCKDVGPTSRTVVLAVPERIEQLPPPPL